jgi:hypothetical protein
VKKIFVVAVSLVLLIMCQACGRQQGRNGGITPPPPTNSNVSPAESSRTETEADSPSNPLTADLTQEFEDKRTGYKLKYKWEGSYSYNGYEYVLGSVDRCIVFSKYYADDIVNATDRENINIENIKNVEDILVEMLPYKVKSLFERELVLSVETVENVSYETGETITVDGCKATRFTGTVTYTYSEGDRHDCPVMGYAIMGSKRPMIIWTTDKSDGEAYFQELTDLVDRIILTFEDEPEKEED